MCIARGPCSGTGIVGGTALGRHVLDVASSVLYVALQVLDELEAGIAAGNSQPLPPDRLVSLAQCLRALP